MGIMVRPMLQNGAKQYLLVSFNLNSSDALKYSGVFNAALGFCPLTYFILFTPLLHSVSVLTKETKGSLNSESCTMFGVKDPDRGGTLMKVSA